MTSADHKTMLLPLDQPQGLCDLIGVAFRIWRRKLGLIMRVLMMPTIIYFITSTAFQWCITYGINNGADLPRIIGIVCLSVLSGLFYIASLFFLSVRQLALLRFFMGFSTDLPRALAYGMKKLWWIVGLSCITGLISAVIAGIWICVIVLSAAITGAGAAAALAGALGMILGVAGLVVSIVLLILLSVMGFSVLACEETGFFDVIARSFYWTFKHFGRVLSFASLFYVIFTAVSLPVSLPILIASVADVSMHQIQSGAAAAGDSKLSVGVMIFVQLWEAFCSLLLRPVSLLCFGLLYLDLRQRAEGLDIARKLNELKSEFGAANEIQGR